MNRRGFTLIEMLITLVIGSIAMFALAAPLIAEGQFFRKGKRQTEAQRDAQMAFRAIARVARQSLSYSIPAAGTLIFTEPVGGQACFQSGANQLLMTRPNCVGGPLGTNTTVLIDGVRSRVQNFTVTQIVPNKLVRIHLEINHRLRTADPFTEQEILETELFLRNGT